MPDPGLLRQAGSTSGLGPLREWRAFFYPALALAPALGDDSRMNIRISTVIAAVAAGFALVANAQSAQASLAPEAFAETPASERGVERMQALDSLVGRWALTSTEHLADGAALQAHGVRTCRWALNHTAIRCDDRFDLFGSVNGALQPVTIVDSLFYLTFNSESGLYEYTYFSPTLPQLRTVPASFDASTRVLTGSAWVTDPAGEPRLAVNESRLLGLDRIEETLSLSLPGSDERLELLEISLERRDGRLPPVLHF